MFPLGKIRDVFVFDSTAYRVIQRFMCTNEYGNCTFDVDLGRPVRDEENADKIFIIYNLQFSEIRQIGCLFSETKL